ncbi:MAG: HNH endonuclease [Crocinitomicaceae bacterium]|nr:HNH endonuclease [Crocinitomicaceae bacterium]MBP6032072.1 HNH endonuclease [Crocinitomicaceae bacterium]
MEEESIQKYLHQVLRLKRSASNGGAPHKPILLLSIFELIRKGDISSNQIEITPELVLEFKSNWSKLVVTQHSPNFSLPFFHMRSEPFWRLITNIGMNIPLTSSHSIKSLNALKESIAFAELDKEFFRLLIDPIQNGLFVDQLLEKYFHETRTNFNSKDYNVYDQLETQMLNDNRAVYSSRIKELKESLPQEQFEEEIFVRGGIFKKEIPKIYNYHCAISGMRIESSTNAQLVDACHIVPFAISKDDTITNGISLSPNIHRAFDRGLITINSEYIIRVSPAIKENDSPFSLKQFDGKQIILPTNIHFYPSIENLDWHRKECFVL